MAGSEAAPEAVVYDTLSEAQTEHVASVIAADLRPGDIILLEGELGAGKTAFVRGLAAGLGLGPDIVSSPTFTLLHEHVGGRLPLYHADLYRLERAAVDDLGLEEAGAGDGVLVIEWPERLAHAIGPAIHVRIDVIGPESRRLTVVGARTRRAPTPSGSSEIPS